VKTPFASVCGPAAAMATPTGALRKKSEKRMSAEARVLVTCLWGGFGCVA
jgi:hypothetical protein